MAADPGGNHTVKSLARIALMSRSAFMSTFAKTLGKTPMAALRDLRMRHAAQLLKYSCLDVEQVSRQSGYVSRAGFTRAFKEAFDKFPTEYRAATEESTNATDLQPDPMTRRYITGKNGITSTISTGRRSHLRN
ncbi:helix-turn-helix transcriptional regulator [Puia sp.]|uniref:helix-turn-helix transcriptional regulator n=1 Tax=Puia sp. TaxID=2045100 RepID=UPI0039C93198